MVMAQAPPKTVLVPVSVQKKENPFKKMFGGQGREGSVDEGAAGPSSAGSPGGGGTGGLSGQQGEIELGKKNKEMIKLAFERLIMPRDTLIILLVHSPPDTPGADALRRCEDEMAANLRNQLRTSIDVASAQNIQVVVEVRLRSDRAATVLQCAVERRVAIVVVYQRSGATAAVMGALGVDSEINPEALAAQLPKNTKVMVASHGRIVNSFTGEQPPLAEDTSMVLSDHQSPTPGMAPPPLHLASPSPGRPLGAAATSVPTEILREVYGETEFRVEEIIQATENFRHEIGQGGSGSVFRGMLRGKDVAVKRLRWWGVTAHMGSNIVNMDQNLRQFLTELRVMRRIHHRNLLQLQGVCVCDSELLLVFDYLRQGSLDRRLRYPPILTWTQRLQIAVGAAAGLKYLHHDCTPAIIHRDVKTANILLDDNLVPQVADFGLAKIAPEMNSSQPFTVSAIMGTQGYLAPEYHSTRTITKAIDVFAFGVVLLELITGHVPFHPERNPPYLSQYAFQTTMDGQYEKLLDKRLGGQPYNHWQLEKALMLAVLCLMPNPVERPRMEEVSHLLNQIVTGGQNGHS